MQEKRFQVITTSIVFVVIAMFFTPALATSETAAKETEAVSTSNKVVTTTAPETTTNVVITTTTPTTTKVETTKVTTTTTKVETTKSTTTTTKVQTAKPTTAVWNGQKLTKKLGVVQGPEGRETFYNLPMQGVIKIAQSELGMYEDYWVREDGVKMYGKYIMCAADFSFKPRGTVVQTSLGEGMILDTGCSYGTIDIAVNWVV